MATSLSVNFIAPGHGKVSVTVKVVSISMLLLMLLLMAKFFSQHALFLWLQQHGVDVSSKTASAIHSPDIQRFHYFDDGELI